MSITSAPTIDNLKIAEQLLAAMTQVSAQLESQLRSYTAQAAILDGIVKAQAAMNNLDPSKAQEVTDALKAAQAAADAAANSIKGGTVNVKDQASETDKIAASLLRAVAVMGEFANGFKAGFNLSKALLGNLLRIGSVGLKGIMGIGQALLSIPGSILSFFQKNASGGSDPWREAIEELRDKFGALQMGTSKAVLGMMDNVSQFNQSGLKLGRVFGHGRAGAAAILKEFSKIAEEMGPSFMPFANAVKGISGELLILTKSTGLSGAALKTLQISADNGGESVKNAVENMNIGLVRAQRTFGISAKEMGKDLEIMMKDVGSFGIMSRDTMIKTSVYVKKLGLSMDALKKVMDKTLNFEDAANSAAGMAEAFNMNIDAFKLMKEQDPTKKLDMMRQAFFRTGKNIDQMSIAERKHLANLSGLSEEEARIAFAQKNRAMTGASLDAQMKKSSKTQITQEQAMHELADSIKRLVVSGGGMQGGFFEMFFKGFEAGITRSREFRQISREIQRDLKIVWQTGRDVGAMFVELFPGIKDMFGGLRDMLNPAKFTELMNKIRNIFGSFFIELQTDPRKGFEHFMERMKKAFFDMFSSDEAGGSQFLQGLKKFWGAIGNIFVQGLRWLLIKATAGIKFILDSIRRVLHNPRGIKAGFKELFDSIINPETSAGAEDGIMSLFGEIMQTLATEILPVLKELWNVIVEFFEDPAVQSTLKNIGMAILGYMFGPAVFMAILRGSLAIGFEILKVAFVEFAKGIWATFGSQIISAGLEFLEFLFSATAGVYLLLAAIVALFVGFAVAPEATGKVVDWITDFLGGLGEMIGKLVGYIIKGVVYLIGGILYLYFGFFFDTQRWLGYAKRVVIALIQAFASVGMMIVKFFGGVLAGVLEVLRFPRAAAAVRKFTKSVIDEVKDFIKNATEYFDFFSQMVESSISGVIDKVIGIFSLGFETMEGYFTRFSNYVSGKIDGALGWIRSKWDSTISAISSGIDAFGKGIDRFVAVLSTPFTVAGTLIDAAGAKITRMIDTVKNDFEIAVKWISDHNPFKLIANAAESAEAVIRRIHGHSMNTVIANDLNKIDASPFERLSKGAEDTFNLVKSGAAKGFELLKTGAQSALKAAGDEMSSFLNNPIEHIKTRLGVAGNIIKNTFQSVQDSVKKILTSLLDDPISFIQDKLKQLKFWIIENSPFPSLTGSVNGVIDTVIQKIEMFRENINTAFKQVKDNVILAFTDPVQFIKNSIQSYADIVTGGFKNITDVVNNVKKEIGVFLKDPVAYVKEDLKNLSRWIQEHNPFALIGRAAEAAAAIVHGIHGHCMNVIIKKDLNKIDASPIAAIGTAAQNSSAVVTQSFAAAARNSNTHVQQIQRNSTTASAAATTAVTPNPHALQQATAGVGQAATAVSQLQNTNVENNAALLGIFGQLRDVINGMVNFVKDAFKDLTPAQATNIKAGVEVISSLFTSIKTIIDIVGSVNASVGSVNIYNAVVAPLFGPDGILSYLFDPAHGEAVRFKEMVKTGGMISVFVASLPANFNEQITKITSVFNFIKSIGDAMSSLHGQTTLPVYNQVIGPLIGTDGILSFLFNEQHAEAVTFKNMFKRGGLISKFVSTLPSDFNVVVAKLISLFAAVKSITESVKTLTDIQTPTALTASPLNIPLSNLALIIENIKQDTITANGITVNNPLKNPHAYFGAMETIYDGLAGKGTLMVRLKDVISEIFTSTKTISELPTFASGENLSNSLVSMTTVLNQLDDSFGVDEGTSSKVSRITSGINNRLIDDVRSMVTQYNSFSRELAALNSINIDATLSRFGEGLSADRQVVLNQAAANVTVNLKITLTAEDIAKALYARVDSGPKAGRPGEFMTAALRPRTGDTIGN